MGDECGNRRSALASRQASISHKAARPVKAACRGSEASGLATFGEAESPGDRRADAAFRRWRKNKPPSASSRTCRCPVATRRERCEYAGRRRRVMLGKPLPIFGFRSWQVREHSTPIREPFAGRSSARPCARAFRACGAYDKPRFPILAAAIARRGRHECVNYGGRYLKAGLMGILVRTGEIPRRRRAQRFRARRPHLRDDSCRRGRHGCLRRA